MKKFLILSSLVAVAGLGVGIATRQDSAPQATSAVAADVTTTTLATEPATTGTTARVATRAATKTTATTTRTVAAPTKTAVTTPTIAAPTTTTTVAAPHQVTPTCSTSAAPATAGSYIGGGTWEDVRISSNMPKTRTRLTVQYPGLKQQFWLTTDASGAAKKIFELRDAGTTSLSVDFYDAAENHVGGSPACQTTFMATEG